MAGVEAFLAFTVVVLDLAVVPESVRMGTLVTDAELSGRGDAVTGTAHTIFLCTLHQEWAIRHMSRVILLLMKVWISWRTVVV